jgi:hypothetical protein
MQPKRDHQCDRKWFNGLKTPQVGSTNWPQKSQGPKKFLKLAFSVVTVTFSSPFQARNAALC